jgi:hypothetical protein
MLPDIEAALDLGHSLTDIHAILNEHGIVIPYKQLSLYIGRIRRQEEKKPRGTRIRGQSADQLPEELASSANSEADVIKSPTSTSEKVPLLKTDPLANLKQKQPSVPNFTASANKEDLY